MEKRGSMRMMYREKRKYIDTSDIHCVECKKLLTEYEYVNNEKICSECKGVDNENQIFI